MNAWQALIERLAQPEVVLALALALLLGAVLGWALQHAGRRRLAVECERLRGQAIELETRLQAERESADNQIAKLEQAEQRLSDTFRRLAGEIFDDRTKRFAELNQERLSVLLNPLDKQLKQFDRLVRESHEKEVTQQKILERELKRLGEMNQRLGDEADQLVQALRGDNRTLGTWGEVQLERLFESAGLEAGREYELQVSLRSAAGAQLRPDALLRLPDNKAIVVDAKVSLEHYTRARGAEDAETREQQMKLHGESLRNHIRGLAARGYTDVAELDTPDFVAMFVPVEAALMDALQHDRGLLEYAMQNRVALLAPTNLLATLRTVASLWRAWRQNENARAIADRAGLLYDKFHGFVGNLREVGQRLEQARSAYDNAYSQLTSGQGNLLRQAEMLRELGARTGKKLDISAPAPHGDNAVGKAAAEDTDAAEDDPSDPTE